MLSGTRELSSIKHFIPQEYRTTGIKYNIIKRYIDLERFFYEVIEEGKQGYVVSGLNPSGPLHIGHYAVFKEVYEWSKLYDLKVNLPLTNDETYVVGKTNSLHNSYFIAKNQVIPLLRKIGFSDNDVYIDTDNLKMYQTAVYISKYIQYKEGRRVFGYDVNDNVGKMFYVSAIQIAQILMPQIIDPINEILEPKPTLIIIGLDQHPYIMLARDIAKKLNLYPPTAVYIDFMPSLIDPNKKMSASKPESAIFLNESEETIRKKIMHGFTGGKSKEEQLRNGGDINRCSVFKILPYLGVEISEIEKIKFKCKSGVLCYNCKKLIAQIVINRLKNQKIIE